MLLQSIFGSKGAFKSLTFWGVAGAIGSTLVGHFEPTILAPNVASGLQLVSGAIAVLGLRKAQSRTVATIADLVSQLAAKRGGGSQ